MTLHLRREREEDATAPLPAKPDAAGRWLASVSRLMRLDEESRRAICEELDGHIRERVRDLMLEGVREEDAVRRALDELGSAAALARRFDSAHTQRRRLLMHASLFAIAGTALVLSIGAVSGAFTRGSTAGTVPADQFRAGQPVAGVPAPALVADGRAPEVKITLEAHDQAIRDVIEAMLTQASKSHFAHWDQIQEAGMELSTRVSIAFKETPLPSALRFLNQSLKTRGSGMLEFRTVDGVLEAAPQGYFDRREAQLVCYDIAEQARFAEREEIVSAIHELVEPDLWRSNGGEIASTRMVGDRLFVLAPPRMHERVSWILANLNRGERKEAPGKTVGGGAGAPPAAPGDATAGLVYLEGVSRSGPYNMPAGGLTLSRAISAAGGPKEGAITVVVLRHQNGQDRPVHELSVQDLMKGHLADPKLQAMDRVVVK